MHNVVSDCTMIEDDWGAVLDAYNIQGLEEEATVDTSKQVPSANAWQHEESSCIRLIRERHEVERSEASNDMPSSSLNNELKIHLVYNVCMAADILNNEKDFNQLQMTRYSMTYEDIPKTLFDKFASQGCLDHSKCERVKELAGNDKKQVLDIEINVKNMNENTGGFKRDAKNMNEIFKFTCQRYHSYITQIIEHFKDREASYLMSNGSVQEESKEKEQKGFDIDFEFTSATRGLGAKVKGIPKLAPTTTIKKSD